MAITQDLCFVVDNPSLDPRDPALFFDTEDVEVLPPTATMVDVVVQAGVFSSRGQAKKNGWKGKQIPAGFSEFKVGKLNHQITILNPASTWEEDQV